jgi:hypothetical protein
MNLRRKFCEEVNVMEVAYDRVQIGAIVNDVISSDCAKEFLSSLIRTNYSSLMYHGIIVFFYLLIR